MSAHNSIVVNVWKCFFSPKLHRVHNTPDTHGVYERNALEKWGDIILQTSYVLWHLTLYSLPFLLYSGYKRGCLTSDEGQLLLLKIGVIGALTVGSAYVLRAVGRATNGKYLDFLDKYKSIINKYNSVTKKELQNYEFDFSAWPVDFNYKNTNADKYKNRSASTCSEGTFKKVFSNPASLLGYLVIHSFGIKMIYPGSIRSINFIIQQNLYVGRKKLIEEKHGERFKLATPDDNELDVFFVDKRGKTASGSTLVICTEGNAGFYEIGIMTTPLDLGYSVLGWNHPGFGSSTGVPYISSEKCAIETVTQFAFQKLNFTPENVILFGWSIGGFASSYAATLYPEVKAVILDATFDEISPLAVKQMPKVLEPIVKLSIKDHADLDVATYLTQYRGPILLIRRSEDEIISLTEGDITTNRGNFLLERILKTRYPQLLTNETQSVFTSWLGVTGPKKDLIYEKYEVNFEPLKAEYENYQGKYRGQYPSNFGKDFSLEKKIQMLLYLGSIYMNDFPSSHCTSLPSSMFRSFSQI